MKNVFKFLGVAFVACTMLVACGGTDVTTYTIKVKANPSDAGTVTGGGKYEEGATATLEATANAGYTFVEWNDGVKNNPRIVTVTEDAEYTAIFTEQTGVKVTFGENTWNAGYINGQATSSAYMIAAAQTEMNSFPFVTLYNLSNGPAVGTFNGDAVLNDDLSANHGDIYLDYYSSEDRGVSLGGNSVGDWWGMNLVINVTAFDPDALTINLVANAEMWDIAGLVYDGITDVANLQKRNLSMTASKVSLAAVKSLPKANVSGKLSRR